MTLTRQRKTSITVTMPKSRIMTKSEPMRQAKPPSVVSAETTIARPRLEQAVSIASRGGYPLFISSWYLSRRRTANSVPIPMIMALIMAVRGFRDMPKKYMAADDQPRTKDMGTTAKTTRRRRR